ncbi:unnamed protein product, partial [Tenebrio molitor]
ESCRGVSCECSARGRVTPRTRRGVLCQVTLRCVEDNIPLRNISPTSPYGENIVFEHHIVVIVLIGPSVKPSPKQGALVRRRVSKKRKG